jgi:hypothetical protein
MLTLEQFLDKFGEDTTSNFDLLRWAKQLGINNFHYAMRDEVKNLTERHNRATVRAAGQKIKKLPIFIIANYETSKENGSHHVALYKDIDHAYYFNSFGTQPFKEAIDFLGNHHTYSTFQIQKMTQKCCGQLSLYFLYCIHNGKNYYDTVFDMLLWALKN